MLKHAFDNLRMVRQVQLSTVAQPRRPGAIDSSRAARSRLRNHWRLAGGRL